MKLTLPQCSRARAERSHFKACAWLTAFSFISMFTGCTVWHDVKRTTKNELVYKTSNHLIEKRVRKLSRRYWDRYIDSHPKCEGNEHFRRGYLDGFERHCLTGKLEPPKFPPLKYRKARFVSGEGHFAIEQWYRGHAAGLIDGERSAYRSFVTLPYRGETPKPYQAARHGENTVYNETLSGVIVNERPSIWETEVPLMEDDSTPAPNDASRDGNAPALESQGFPELQAPVIPPHPESPFAIPVAAPSRSPQSTALIQGRFDDSPTSAIWETQELHDMNVSPVSFTQLNEQLHRSQLNQRVLRFPGR